MHPMNSLSLSGAAGNAKTQMTLMNMQITPLNPYPNITAPSINGGNIDAYPKIPPCAKALKIPRMTILILIRTSAVPLLLMSPAINWEIIGIVKPKMIIAIKL